MAANVRRWALAVVGRAPMGASEALVLIVTGGLVVLSVPIASLVPKPTDSPLLWIVWLIVAVAAVALFLRGVIGFATLVIKSGFSLRTRGSTVATPPAPEPTPQRRTGILAENMESTVIEGVEVSHFDVGIHVRGGGAQGGGRAVIKDVVLDGREKNDDDPPKGPLLN